MNDTPPRAPTTPSTAPPRRYLLFRGFRGLRGFATSLLLGGLAYAPFYGNQALLPQTDALARGLRLGGVAVAEGSSKEEAAQSAAARILAQRYSFTWDDEVIVEASLDDLGGSVDVDDLAERAFAVGRKGALFARIGDALEARRGLVDFPVRVRVPVERFAERVARFKEEHDVLPRNAKLDLSRRAVTPHLAGRYLDVYAAMAALDRAIEAGERNVDVPSFAMIPRASSEAVAAIDTSAVVARYETRFGEDGKQRGRAENIRTAAGRMNGVVLMPFETVSFNANVGPRSVENGFFSAPEIYKGETRFGVGGGTCQVAGTLHAAALFGGITIAERSSHSRPSGYIGLGLDATVVYPTVDLKLYNPYDFPILVRTILGRGTLAFELVGREKPATVELETTPLGTAHYKRKIEERAALPEGKFVLKQKGIRGVSIRKRRTIHFAKGGRSVEIATDTYPPTFEIYQVPPGTDPDSLPPLSEDNRSEDSRATASSEAAEPLSAASMQ